MKENTNKIEINHLIAICNTIDNYELFNNNLIQFLNTTKNKIELIYKLGKISNSEISIPYPKIIKFYKENKIIIDIINKNSNIHTFICQNYQYDKTNQNTKFKNQNLYKYILNNKKELNKILDILEKLKNLGFTDIEFNENLDFTTEKYYIYSNLSSNFDIIYLDNLEAIPSYSYGQINYKTTGSNYKMTLGLLGSEKNFCKYSKKIILNSLIFDPDTLPKEISHQEITHKILELPNIKEEEYSIIRTSVDLSTNIDDLLLTYLNVNRSIENLNINKNKEEIIAVLSNIRDNILKLKGLSVEYDEEQIHQNEYITEHVLSREKELYQRNREFLKLHID